MKIPKVIFLDWNGTLSDSLSLDHMTSSKDPSRVSLAKKWDNALFKDNRGYIREWMRGKYTYEEVFRLVAKKTNSNYKQIVKEYKKGWQSMIYCHKDIPSIVEKLRDKGIKVVIATNNMDCFTKWTVPYMKLDTIFDEVINSYDMKALKHDINSDGNSIFFKDFFNKYDINPKDCVFIDDSYDRNEYIESLGMKYIQINDSYSFINLIKNYL